jgi:hypothetical protein
MLYATVACASQHNINMNGQRQTATDDDNAYGTRLHFHLEWFHQERGSFHCWEREAAKPLFGYEWERNRVLLCTQSAGDGDGRNSHCLHC